MYRLLLLITVDFIFFGSTSATKVTSYLVIVGFVLWALSVYAIIYYALVVIKMYGLPIKNKRRLTSYLTILFSGFFALQSIGELSTKDILVIMPIAIIGYAYINYFRSDSQQIT